MRHTRCARHVLAVTTLLLMAACDAPDGFYGQTLPEAVAMPLIRTQPQAQAVREGAAARFVVEVEGRGPLTYQWQRNGVDVAGATQATLVVPLVARRDDHARYAVVVGNSLARITSRQAELQVAARPTLAASDQAPSATSR
jgi:hypothetical protein